MGAEAAPRVQRPCRQCRTPVDRSNRPPPISARIVPPIATKWRSGNHNHVGKPMGDEARSHFRSTENGAIALDVRRPRGWGRIFNDVDENGLTIKRRLA
jgi:hypothetical protein